MFNAQKFTIHTKNKSKSISSRFIQIKTAATRPLAIERALKTDILTTLAVYQLHILIPTDRLFRLCSCVLCLSVHFRDSASAHVCHTLPIYVQGWMATYLSPTRLPLPTVLPINCVCVWKLFYSYGSYSYVERQTIH